MPKSRLAGLYSHRRWTAEDAETVLSAQAASGLSIPAFAAREGFDDQRLYFWRRRLEETSQAAPPPTFIEVRGQTVAVPRERVEIVLRSGRVVRVNESIDAAVLRRLIAVLEESAC